MLLPLLCLSLILRANGAFNNSDSHFDSFVTTNGPQFVVNGHPLYVNGFNAYYLTSLAIDSQDTASQILQQAASAGLTVCRTWAFNDGDYHALQTSPGVYNEDSFKALDFVLNEAKSVGIRVILSLVDNYANMGGKAKYVEWARDAGASIYSEDDFFTNPITKSFYMNYTKDVLSRVNTLTGVVYKDDATIFAWELMNEPRCPSDPSGDTLNNWIQEMSSHLKSIDGNHLVEAGLEGFYGPSSSDQKQLLNPRGTGSAGTDYVRHAQIDSIDFTTAHAYPDAWLSGEATVDDQVQFMKDWVAEHIEDNNVMIGKPVLFAEFGYGSHIENTDWEEGRKDVFTAMYENVYQSAAAGGAGAGALLWQLCTPSVESQFATDGYAVWLSPSSPISDLIAMQDHRLSLL